MGGGGVGVGGGGADKKGAPAKRTCCRRKRVNLWDTKLMKEQAPAQYARPRFPTMQAGPILPDLGEHCSGLRRLPPIPYRFATIFCWRG